MKKGVALLTVVFLVFILLSAVAVMAQENYPIFPPSYSWEKKPWIIYEGWNKKLWKIVPVPAFPAGSMHPDWSNGIVITFCGVPVVRIGHEGMTIFELPEKWYPPPFKIDEEGTILVNDFYFPLLEKPSE